MSESVDVVVVGSGAGGAPVAATLAEAGASVLVLERGPRRSRRDFRFDELRVARREYFVPTAERDPHILLVDDKPPERSNEGWIAVGVGGGTVHMSGFFYRFRPEDFALADTLGQVKGAAVTNWPLTYDELEPYYARMERDIGVSGAADEGPHVAKRAGPYPYGPMATHPIAGAIDDAAKKLGLASFVTARAIVGQPVAGRGACHYHDLCGGFGCDSGAKSSTLETYIPRAEATGKCRVVADARAHQILVDDTGKATGVVYRDAAGVDHEVRARVVVVACSAVESVRLLMLSQGKGFPRGLGNSNGMLGQYVLFSTLSKAHGSFRFSTDAARATLLKTHGGFLGRSIADFYVPKDKQAPVRKAGGLNFLFPAGGPVFQSEQVAARGASTLWGAELKKALAEYWLEQRQLDCETFGEYLPTPGTRVELDPSVKDAMGHASARIHVSRSPHDYAVSRYLADRASEVLDAAGADRVWQSNLGARTMHLPMGGARMGTDPKLSVVDKACRLHDCKNVYVSDAAVFPSSGGWPPTATILANALRVADGIREALAKREL